MQKLSQLLAGVSVIATSGNLEVDIRAIAFDSRAVGAGDVFVAMKGTAVDGHQYIAQAFEKGAVAVVYEDAGTVIPDGKAGIQVLNAGYALGFMASNFYGNPTKRLKVVGITGTNGKTTTVTLLYRLFSALGVPTGMVSTIENRIADQVLDTKFTTPDALSLNQLFAQMLEAGCTHCFMEVSSHALVQGRVAGVQFAGAIFSNITHDHLDYHGTFAEYIKAKKILFDTLPKQSFALVNKDDRRWQVMLQNCEGKHHTFALKAMADFRGRVIDNTFEGLHLEINGKEAWFRLIGDFNASNLLGIYAAAVLLGQAEEEVLRVLSMIKPARGRFEQLLMPNDVRAVVDYAHTPDALKNVLETIQQIRKPGERIITVVGCGGNRDATKRPKMAAIAAQLSEKVILTSDNPRNEEPMAILKEMEQGLSIAEKTRTATIEDRREAIRRAVAMANPGDVILVAGKGHETYQEIKGVRHHFDDLEELRNLIS